jgi:ABC-type hemin transport system ATPase subunit
VGLSVGEQQRLQIARILVDRLAMQSTRDVA